MFKKVLQMTVCLLMIAFFIAGCRLDGEHAGSRNTIVVAGSTTVAPVMRELATAFESLHDDIHVEVQELGTSAGINATIQGVSDIAMASRAISEFETEQGINSIAFAFDGVAVIVNPDNPINDLSSDQITAIFRGNISNWRDVGGKDAAITVVSREEGSGIRQTFETFANVQDEVQVGDSTVMTSAVARPAIISQGTGSVIAAVSGNRNAIGYVTTGVVVEGLNPVAINGIMFSEETVLTGQYVFANTFFIGVMDDLSYLTQSFIDFILSESGQDIVSNTGYVRVR